MQNISIVLASLSGALLTFYLQSRGLSPVLASCLVGLLGVLLAQVLDIPQLEIAVFTGSFVGMSSDAVMSSLGVGVAGAVAGLLLLMLRDFAVGFGGKLGTLAFVSVCVIFWLIRWFR